jgi:hypothetical protein
LYILIPFMWSFLFETLFRLAGPDPTSILDRYICQYTKPVACALLIAAIIITKVISMYREAHAVAERSDHLWTTVRYVVPCRSPCCFHAGTPHHRDVYLREFHPPNRLRRICEDIPPSADSSFAADEMRRACTPTTREAACPDDQHCESGRAAELWTITTDLAEYDADVESRPRSIPRARRTHAKLDASGDSSGFERVTAGIEGRREDTAAAALAEEPWHVVSVDDIQY